MSGLCRKWNTAFLKAALLLAPLGLSAARAQETGYSIHLVDIHQGSQLSDTAAGLGRGGYELSDGTWVSFREWYQRDWIDLFVDLIAQRGDDFGILWGASSGERGEKYRIDPSFKLGFISQSHPRPNVTLSLSITTILGGRLTEFPCQADYGDIGGVQSVNCRLAASPIPPEDTLQYLANEAPSRLSISLGYRLGF